MEENPLGPLVIGRVTGAHVGGIRLIAKANALQLGLGYVHNLSKRTALYTTYSYINNDGKTASYNMGINPGLKNSTYGFDFGVKHSF